MGAHHMAVAWPPPDRHCGAGAGHNGEISGRLKGGDAGCVTVPPSHPAPPAWSPSQKAGIHLPGGTRRSGNRPREMALEVGPTPPSVDSWSRSENVAAVHGRGRPVAGEGSHYSLGSREEA